jgi:hypothetical protein
MRDILSWVGILVLAWWAIYWLMRILNVARGK